MYVSSEYDVCGALLTLGTSLNKVGNIAPSGLMNVIVHEKKEPLFFSFSFLYHSDFLFTLSHPLSAPIHESF